MAASFPGFKFDFIMLRISKKALCNHFECEMPCVPGVSLFGIIVQPPA